MDITSLCPRNEEESSNHPPSQRDTGVASVHRPLNLPNELTAGSLVLGESNTEVEAAIGLNANSLELNAIAGISVCGG